MNIVCELDPDELENYRLRQLEDEWTNSLPRFTDAFLLETFGDALDTMDDKVAELRQDQEKYIKDIYYLGQKYVHGDDLSSCFARLCIELFFIGDLQKTEKSLFLIQRLRGRKNQPKNKKKGVLTSDDIENARNVSLVYVAERQIGQLRRNGNNFIAKCPFHDERTPSFYIYSESNRFYCFGCGASGDVIAFVEKSMGVDFKAAIYYLIQE